MTINNGKCDVLNQGSNQIGEFSVEVLSYEPQALFSPIRKKFPGRGNYYLYINISSPQSVIDLTIYFEVGTDATEEQKVTIPIQTNYINRKVIRIPAGLKKIHIDPSPNNGKIKIIEFRLEKISTWMTLRNAYHSIKQKIQSLEDLSYYIMKGSKLILSGGFEPLKQYFYINDRQNYSQWLNLFGEITTEMETKMKAKIKDYSYKPLFSILLPTYNTKQKWLVDAVQSVQDQIYPVWELCISDDCSLDPIVRETIRELAAQDTRIKFVFRNVNGHISANTNSALEIAEGEYIVLLDHDDLLSKDALYQAVKVLQQNRDANLIYSDEDKITEQGDRYDPYFKPDWNPDLFLAQNFVNHLTIYKTDLVKNAGGFRVGLEGAQDWDLALRVIEQIDEKTIIHIPMVLYHWRTVSGSTAKNITQKNYVVEAQRKALEDHFYRTKQSVDFKMNAYSYWTIQYKVPRPKPLVSIIIPTRNQKKILEKCINSLEGLTDYDPYEILVVNNDSDQAETLNYFDILNQKPGIRVLDYPFSFNYSAINNFAVKESKGGVLCLLNNDIEIIDANWLWTMVSLAIRPQTGAVGAKLYYPNGRIQHAGVILGLGGVAGHAYQFKSGNFPGQMGRARLSQNYSAVTGACLVVEKNKYVQVGGLNENELKIAFNDIDFCIKLILAGYRNVWSSEARLAHRESFSRGSEDTSEKQNRFKKEIDYMKETYGGILWNDPAYNPNLSLEKDFSLAFPPRVDCV